ncbi:MAG: hypothetical protein ACYTG0_16035 [Planctomycetota bacterium]|jgi:hypothetical protein
MSKRSLARTLTQQWESIWREYQSEHPGAFADDDLLDWALKQDLVDLPRTNPRALLKRQLKRALRAARIRDPQGRKVREMLAVKTEAMDANGNRIFEVVWDHIHEMSLDHALTSFDQRDRNINKQRLVATKDVQSCLDNNPNVVGHESQFVFDFMTEETEAQIVETIEDSGPLTALH